MYSKVVVVRNPSGLHARPASEFVSKAKNFQSKISIRRPGDSSFLGNAKSIIIMLSMGMLRVMPWNSWLMVLTSGRQWTPCLI